MRKPFMFELMKGLTGRDLRTRDEVWAFIYEKYTPLEPDWFDALQRSWGKFTLQARVTRDHFLPNAKIRGLPLFFALAAAGMLVALFGLAGHWRFHVPWLLAFCGVWTMVLLTGVVNARYRFVFEPFCVLYLLLFFDVVWTGARLLFRRCKTGEELGLTA